MIVSAPSRPSSPVLARMVAIEGPRGVGKTTITAHLRAALGCGGTAADQAPVADSGSPGGDWRGEFETRMHRLLTASGMCDQPEHAPVFVVDGYVRTAAASHADEHDLPTYRVERLLIDHRALLRTPLTICLTASVDTLARRLREKEGAQPQDLVLAASPKRLGRMVEYHGPYGQSPAPGTVIHTEDRTPDQVLTQVLDVLARHRIHPRNGAPSQVRARLPTLV
ncbi:AAA family ATPase (plasmid) [Embleya sp. NBC_00888]|uniref:hypothetical protein n=1 Tax=Embleya sp. NBC_00888 TaxID=2975960 RepID=UPI0038689EA9|nr:AAA family ATPase [Embleya sp. NBC_00888]